jgi:hypothetical protein
MCERELVVTIAGGFVERVCVEGIDSPMSTSMHVWCMSSCMCV